MQFAVSESETLNSDQIYHQNLPSILPFYFFTVDP